mmetsp:Transcript_8971/g.13299  ORF Transcript_8971/g.13299 Transcript_8971/m.13299 type:complete len:213 (-) Transcript_8971:1870-2508(-)
MVQQRQQQKQKQKQRKELKQAQKDEQKRGILYREKKITEWISRDERIKTYLRDPTTNPNIQSNKLKNILYKRGSVQYPSPKKTQRRSSTPNLQSTSPIYHPKRRHSAIPFRRRSKSRISSSSSSFIFLESPKTSPQRPTSSLSHRIGKLNIYSNRPQSSTPTTRQKDVSPDKQTHIRLTNSPYHLPLRRSSATREMARRQLTKSLKLPNFDD